MSGGTGRGWHPPAWVKILVGVGAVAGGFAALVLPPLFADPPRLAEQEPERKPSGRALLERPPTREGEPVRDATARTPDEPPREPDRRPRRRPNVTPIAMGASESSTGAHAPDPRHAQAQHDPFRRDRPPAYPTPPQPAPQPAQADPASLQGQMGGALVLDVVHAGQGGDGDYVIDAHTHIPCTPYEDHNGTLAGLVTCETKEWVRGNTQRYGLLPPGTRFRGQVRAGMANGGEVLGVHYTSLRTSGDRFQVRFAGFGTELMGEAGLRANEETFFWSNAGKVGVYALIQGVAGAVPNALGAALGANTIVGLNLGGAGQNLAALAMQGNAMRRPQSQRPHAIPAFVTVAQDLDFTRVCRERRRVNPDACPAM